MATLDTKGDEAKFLKDLIEEKGCKTIVVDTGILGEPYFEADISREEVAIAGERSIKDLVEAASKGASRGSATAVMSKGLNKILKTLYATGKLDAVIGLGGGTGTFVVCTAMQKLPLGVPKLQVATHPGTRGFGITDITQMQSVCDLVGINSILKQILINAAGAIVGMAEVGKEVKLGDKPTVGIPCWGVVTPGAMNMVKLLEEKGYEPVLVHGATAPLEDMIERGWISGLIDLCAQELIALHVYNRTPTTGLNIQIRKDRFEAVGRKGLPWIFTPGTLDASFFPLDDPQFKNRKKTAHSPGHYLVRTSSEELTKLGEAVAKRANAATGPVAIVIPLQGLSANNSQGLPLYDHEADMAFAKAVKENVHKHIKVLEVDAHINDMEYAKVVVNQLDLMFNEKKIKDNSEEDFPVTYKKGITHLLGKKL